MKKVKIGIIGVGVFGITHLDWYKTIPEAEVVAICDINEDRLNEVGDEYGIARRYQHISEILAQEDIEAVDVVMPNNFHAPVAIAAMEAGKDVFVEKPLAGTYADACAMVECSERTGRRLYMQLGCCFADDVKVAKRFVDAGDLGHIYHVRSTGWRRRGRPFVDGIANSPSYCSKETAGGGALYDMAIYQIGELYYLLGLPKLERVTGHLYLETDMDPVRKEQSKFDVDEFAVGFATFEGGMTLDLVQAWACHGRRFEPSMIFGSKGGISLTPSSVTEPPVTFYTRMHNLEVDVTADIDRMNILDHNVNLENSHYDNAGQHWVHALLGLCPLLPTAKIGKEVLLLQEGVTLSHELGREVTVEEIKARSVSKAVKVQF